MKSVMLKSTPDGALTLAHPHAAPGWVRSHGGPLIYEITDVPDDVTPATVLALANTTAIVSRCIVPFSSLGVGRIVYGRVPA